MNILLLPFSWIYGWIIRGRNRWFELREEKLYKAPLPVVSIGNISTGGTGKTPFSEYVLRFFISQGLRPAYLSRGYGRSSRGYRLVDPNALPSTEFGDEALQVALKFPKTAVAVCESRAEGIRQLLASQGVDVIVLDDAFQHRKLRRDVDIVLFDANRLPQQDHLLPAGRLREPLSSLRRADLLIVNKLLSTAKIPELREKFLPWQKPMAFCTPEFEGLFDFFSAEKVKWEAAKHQLAAVLFSGLGNNAFFQKQVEAQGIEVLEVFKFPDHYRYKEKDMQQIASAFQNHTKISHKFDAILLLTTEKDRSRLIGQPILTHWQGFALCYLPIRLTFWEGEEQIKTYLQQTVVKPIQQLRN